jgi:hypothetical protein
MNKKAFLSFYVYVFFIWRFFGKIDLCSLLEFNLFSSSSSSIL